MTDEQKQAVIDRDFQKMLDLGGNVSGISLSPDGRHLYAANLDLHRLDVVDTGTLRVVAQTEVGKGPVRPVPTRNGRYVLVSNFRDSTVTIVDGRSYQAVRTVGVGNGPIPAVVGPSGRWAWVANSGDGTATQIDLTRLAKTGHRVLRTVPVGQVPWMLRLNASGSTLFVANKESNFVSVVCTKDGSDPGALAASGPASWLIGGPWLYTGGSSSTVSAYAASALGAERCP